LADACDVGRAWNRLEQVMYTQREITAVTRVLKERFGNLTTDELLDLAFKILNTLMDARA